MTCGEGVKRREVVCVKKLDKLTVIVSDENCIEPDRAEEEEACSEGLCPPIWFTTDWSEVRVRLPSIYRLYNRESLPNMTIMLF